MMATQPKPDLLRFIADTIKGTVSATRSRLVIFFVILFLQFLVVPLIMSLPVHDFPDTYVGMKKRIEYMSAVEAFVGSIKYILLLILLIMSPAERTGKRRLAKYIVLLGSLYLWIMMSIMASVFEHSYNQQELAERSFKENAVPIYGKVVFSSYNREENDHKRLVSVAEKLSQNTTGYIVIVQLNDSAYNYHGLKGLYQHFNYYTHSKEYPTHIPVKDTNLSNCLQFSFKFPPSLKKVPALPVQDKYIRILYDPYENTIEMFTDSTSAVAPTFDSIPALSHQ